MYINIFLVLFSLLVFIRGILFYLAKYKEMDNNKLSFIETDNKEEFLYVNKLASLSYMIMGAILSVLITVLNLCFPMFFRQYYIIVCLIVVFVNYFCKVLVDIRLQIDKQLKIWEKEDKERDE